VIRDALVSKLARDTVADSGISEPPVDLDLIARRAGISIMRGASLPSGMKACYDDHRAEVRVRSGLTSNEERFAVAHELGHHFLEHGGHECRGVEFAAVVLDIDDASGDVDAEREASAFAGQLMVPREWCRRDLEAGMTEPGVAVRYHVSKEVAFITVQAYRFRLGRGHRRR
jgi:Zn-dependent peptidase ImmA (M78 family)